MESSIAEFLKRQLACELLPTTSNSYIHTITCMSMTHICSAATRKTSHFIKFDQICTVAILAQGTHWAVAVTQAFFCRLDSFSCHSAFCTIHSDSSSRTHMSVQTSSSYMVRMPSLLLSLCAAAAAAVVVVFVAAAACASCGVRCMLHAQPAACAAAAQQQQHGDSSTAAEPHCNTPAPT